MMMSFISERIWEYMGELRSTLARFSSIPNSYVDEFRFRWASLRSHGRDMVLLHRCDFECLNAVWWARLSLGCYEVSYWIRLSNAVSCDLIGHNYCSDIYLSEDVGEIWLVYPRPNIDQVCQVIQPFIILRDHMGEKYVFFFTGQLVTFSKESQDTLTKLVRLMLLINEKLKNLQ